MQSDDVIWDVVGKNFCSYKRKFKDIVLCQHPYNVTGLCMRTTCPLANGNYGTILEEDGVCFLYLKTVERSHTPRYMWEKIRLSEDTGKAFEQIDRHMMNIYKDYQIQRCKKRLCKIREYLRRMTHMAAQPKKVLEYETGKVRRRERKREVVALRAAQLQTTVERELVSRLAAGHYGDIYNFSPAFNELHDEEEEDEEEIERGYDEGPEDELEDDIEEMF
ncbi:MAK16 protein [Gregarina niphandrodes]|uniref:Protein MAK16 homolog n=1 Tax=Gregarina niphandrodes TaxID=110365 RepID=A0A023B080_GRENI|nr:MAK16 protein [Gregarina niphandrodes]EZG45003.1 MAK16 protein [Gregarina niphandrodes]|eukprot:XP_011132602.1 MAK16 protein [Gregarina niphandrodes]